MVAEAGVDALAMAVTVMAIEAGLRVEVAGVAAEKAVGDSVEGWGAVIMAVVLMVAMKEAVDSQVGVVNIPPTVLEAWEGQEHQVAPRAMVIQVGMKVAAGLAVAARVVAVKVEAVMVAAGLAVVARVAAAKVAAG